MGPSFQAVESMTNGDDPNTAAIKALNRIRDAFPEAGGALITINPAGEIGAACINYNDWTYLSKSVGDDKVVITTIECNKDNSSVRITTVSSILLLITFILF